MVREYIGARYVPKFVGTYDPTQAYEALCVVDNGMGTSYITKIPTPAGTPLTDTDFYAVYGASSGAIINLQNQIGDLNDLNTTDKDSLVDAINEVDGDIQTLTKKEFNTVADMVANVTDDGFVKVNGYYNYGDGGSAYYEIKNTGIADGITVLECASEKFAHLVIADKMSVKQFGSHGDGTDDTTIFQTALNNCKVVVVPFGDYAISNSIVLEHNALIGEELGHDQDILPTLTIDSAAQIEVRARGNVLKNFHLVAATSGSGTAIKLLPPTGVNPGHSLQNDIENLIIDDFEYGIYFNAVVWNCVFKRIRVNFCDRALYKNDSNTCFGNTFINFYTSGSKHTNIEVIGFSATFINGIFGFSNVGAIRCGQNSNIVFIGCNFEADRHLTSAYNPDNYTSLIHFTGGAVMFDGCLFAPNQDAGIFTFEGGAGLRAANFKSCYANMSVSGNLSDAFLNNTKRHSANYGGIVFDKSCSGIDIQYTGTYALQNSYKPDVIYEYGNGLINIANESSADTTKLTAGKMLFDISANAIKMYNGSQFVTL